MVDTTNKNVLFLLSYHFVQFYKPFPLSSLSSLNKNFPINRSKQKGPFMDFRRSLVVCVKYVIEILFLPIYIPTTISFHHI